MNENQPEGFDLLKHAQAHSQELIRTIEVRPGAEVDVKYIGKKAWRKLRKSLHSVRGGEAAQDEAAYNATHRKLAEAVVGWRGMSKDVVLKLIPVEPEALPDELPFTRKNVLALLLYSAEFSNAIADTVDDLDGFREEVDKEAALGNS